MRPMVNEINAATGEETLREMNDVEYAVYLEDQKLIKVNQEQVEALETLRQAARSKLIDLGLTEEEIAAL